MTQLVKNLPAMWEAWVGKIPWRREELATHSSILESSMGRGAWRDIVHGVAELDGTERLLLSLYRGSLSNSFLSEAKDPHLEAHQRDSLETWDMTIPLAPFSCNTFMYKVWRGALRLESKRESPTILPHPSCAEHCCV